MTCGELRRDAVGLASLPMRDELRRTAYDHAHGCEGCARALSEGAHILALIDALPPPPTPSPEVMARVRDALRAELELEHRASRRWSRLRLVPLLALLAGFLLVGRRDLAATPSLVAALTLVAVALGACALSLSRGLGGGALAAVLVTSIAAVAFARHGDALAWAVGAHCLITEIITAALPLVTVSLVMWRARARGQRVEVSAVALGALGAAGALAGQAALLLHCHMRSLDHELIFHSGGVALAAVLSAALARLVARRWLVGGKP